LSAVPLSAEGQRGHGRRLTRHMMDVRNLGAQALVLTPTQRTSRSSRSHHPKERWSTTGPRPYLYVGMAVKIEAGAGGPLRGKS